MKLSILCCALLAGTLFPGLAQADRHRFGVADDIQFERFADPDVDISPKAHIWSPDHSRLAVVTYHGDLSTNRVVSTIWVFQASEIEQAIKAGAAPYSVTPRAVATMAGLTSSIDQPGDDAAISEVQWSTDGQRVLFLGRQNSTDRSLFSADVRSGKPTQLTPPGQNVGAYSVEGDAVAYAVLNPVQAPPPKRVLLGSDRALEDLLNPERREHANQYELWLISHGQSRAIKDASGVPVRLTKKYAIGSIIVSLSPNHKYVVLSQAPASVPATWAQYKTGLEGIGGMPPRTPEQMVEEQPYTAPELLLVVNLETGKSSPVVDSPLGRDATWLAPTEAIWSRDSKEILLTNIFLPLEGVSDDEREKRGANPSILLFNPEQGSWRSIGSIRQSTKTATKSWRGNAIEWNQDKGEVDVHYSEGGPGVEKLYTGAAPENGQPSAAAAAQAETHLEVSVRQGLNQPPIVVGSLGGPELPLWNPNPQLGNLDMGTAEAYDWKDEEGRPIKGVLFKPSDWTPDRRYPLVIEARSYHQDRFYVDGTYQTAVAARAMVEDGMLVLQAGEPPMQEKDMFVGATARALGGYEAAIKKLAAAGMIDASRVGIIGFSRTCDNVMYAISKGPGLFAAATSANGLTYGPVQYLTAVDESLDPMLLQQFEQHYGGKPLGSGLKQWESENAIFQISHVQTPLRVETHDPKFAGQLLMDWESFAALRSLDKPADLIVLPYATHVVSMPSDLEESQQGDVDWFRFWLQGYEDPDSAKAEQYRRWEKLCDLQKEQNPGRPAYCVASNR